METRDPRAELIKQWAMENPGLMAQAGLAGFEKNPTQGDHYLGFGKDVIRQYTEEINSKKAKKHHAKHHNYNHDVEKAAKDFAKIFSHALYGVHKHKHENKYMLGPYDPEYLKKNLVGAQLKYNEILDHLRSKDTIKYPKDIKESASNLWTKIEEYKKHGSFDSVFSSLEKFAEHLSEKTSHKPGIFKIKKPRDPTKIDRNSLHEVLVSKFLYIIQRYIQVNYKNKEDRHLLNYYQVKHHYNTLKKERREIKDLNEALKKASYRHEYQKKGVKSDAADAFSTEHFSMARPTL